MVEELGDQDRGAIATLLDTVAETDEHPPLSEAMLIVLFGCADPARGDLSGRACPASTGQGTDAGLRLEAGVIARTLGTSAPAGYAQLCRGSKGWSAGLVLHPRWREAPEEVTKALLGEVLGLAALRGGGQLQLFVSRPSRLLEASVEETGLAPSRTLVSMRTGLPLGPGCDGLAVATRPFVVGRDEAPWLAANNRAFAGHPDQSNWTLADLEAREHLSWFDAESFLLHEVDQQIAAFCWTKLHRFGQGPPFGEIYVLGVDPAFQGRSLGRAMCCAGAAALERRGARTAMLYVDATNERALALYRSLGFARDHEDRVWSIQLPRGGEHR